MIYEIVGTAIVLFLVMFLGFKQGLRLGMTTAKGEVPKPIKNPVRAIQDLKEDNKAKKEIDKAEKELTDIMGATKESMLDAMKRGE